MKASNRSLSIADISERVDMSAEAGERGWVFTSPKARWNCSKESFGQKARSAKRLRLLLYH